MTTATKTPKKPKAKKPDVPAPAPPAPRISVIVSDGNYVGALQEAAVREGIALPVYEEGRASGPDHERIFSASVALAGRSMAGVGSTKKLAKSAAACRWTHEFGSVAEK